MLEIIQDRKAIKDAQEYLASRMYESADDVGQTRVGFQGGTKEIEYCWYEELHLWASFTDAENRYWNAFGMENPREASTTTDITVEINPPHEGIHRRIAGAFAKGRDGSTHLVHRGNIGGGRSGIGKKNYFAWRRAHGHELQPVQDGECHTEVIVISELEARRFPAHLAHFVETVAEFKKAIAAGEFKPDRAPSAMESASENLPEERPSEFFGTYRLPARAATVAEADHGLVVRQLSEVLENRGFDVRGDEVRDVIVAADHAGESWLLEVKTTTRKYDLYTGIGQLAYHGVEFDHRMLVLPADASERELARLEQIERPFIVYDWDQDAPEFSDFPIQLGPPREKSAP